MSISFQVISLLLSCFRILFYKSTNGNIVSSADLIGPLTALTGQRVQDPSHKYKSYKAVPSSPAVYENWPGYDTISYHRHFVIIVKIFERVVQSIYLRIVFLKMRSNSEVGPSYFRLRAQDNSSITRHIYLVTTDPTL